MSRLLRIDISKCILLIMWLILGAHNVLLAQSSINQVNDLLSQKDTPEKEDSEEERISAAPLAVAVNPVMKIRQLEKESQIYSFELKDADIRDVFKVLAYDHKLNLLVDNEVQGMITATMSEVSLGHFLEAIAKSLNLVIENNGNFFIVKPDLITRVFVLKYIEARDVLNPSKNDAAEDTKRESTIYDLLSAKGKLLLSKQPNSIMVIDYPPNVKKIEDYLNEIDRRMSSQVFKLKYLKASDIAGVENDVQAGTDLSASEGSETHSLTENSTITGG